MPIAFPVIVSVYGKVVVAPLESLGILMDLRGDHRIFCCQSFRKPESRALKWLVEYSGAYRSLRFITYHHKWLQPLRYLWNFVREEYEVGSPEVITVGRLRQLLRESTVSKYEDEPVAPWLIMRLQELQFSDDDIVTEELLRRVNI